MKPENKEQSQTVLKYHVVAGKFTAKDIFKLFKKGDGKAMLKTVSGSILIVWAKGNVYVSDKNGNAAKVTIADVNQSSESFML